MWGVCTPSLMASFIKWVHVLCVTLIALLLLQLWRCSGSCMMHGTVLCVVGCRTCCQGQ